MYFNSFDTSLKSFKGSYLTKNKRLSWQLCPSSMRFTEKEIFVNRNCTRYCAVSRLAKFQIYLNAVREFTRYFTRHEDAFPGFYKQAQSSLPL